MLQKHPFLERLQKYVVCYGEHFGLLLGRTFSCKCVFVLLNICFWLVPHPPAFFPVSAVTVWNADDLGHMDVSPPPLRGEPVSVCLPSLPGPVCGGERKTHAFFLNSQTSVTATSLPRQPLLQFPHVTALFLFRPVCGYGRGAVIIRIVWTQKTNNWTCCGISEICSEE